ncbi:hypothetical protein [Flavobacterium johnsoniae]|uniref:hypothetical protein n=1 Tax=unclassified Flavobacterium TaxID=196869 RepID=UPI000EAF57CE
MKKLSFILFSICLIFASCSSDNEESAEETSKRLDKMYNEIIELSLINSQTCTNPEEWGFELLSSSGCGTNRGYILYSKKADKAKLDAKIKEYIKTKSDYVTKWNVLGDCAPTNAPTSINCVDGKAKLVFQNPL